jgi:hypothetical protein
VLALTVERGRATAPVHDGTEVRVGDVVSFVASGDTTANAWARIAEGGWTRLEPGGRSEPRAATSPTAATTT